jgi:hypothetical protein
MIVKLLIFIVQKLIRPFGKLVAEDVEVTVAARRGVSATLSNSLDQFKR